jgi:hypothetical protein
LIRQRTRLPLPLVRSQMIQTHHDLIAVIFMMTAIITRLDFMLCRADRRGNIKVISTAQNVCLCGGQRMEVLACSTIVLPDLRLDTVSSHVVSHDQWKCQSYIFFSAWKDIHEVLKHPNYREGCPTHASSFPRSMRCCCAALRPPAPAGQARLEPVSGPVRWLFFDLCAYHVYYCIYFTTLSVFRQ